MEVAVVDTAEDTADGSAVWVGAIVCAWPANDEVWVSPLSLAPPMATNSPSPSAATAATPAIARLLLLALSFDELDVGCGVSTVTLEVSPCNSRRAAEVLSDTCGPVCVLVIVAMPRSSNQRRTAMRKTAALG